MSNSSSDWLIAEWSEKLADSIEMMTETRPGFKAGVPISAGAPELSSDMLWISTPLDLAPDCALFVGAPEDSWIEIGGADDARGTYLEMLSQATSGLARSLSGRLGRPVASLTPKESKPARLESAIPIDVSLAKSSVRRIYLAWSKIVEAQLDPPLAAPSKTFDLLMEVELPVSVSFGRAELPLREVLKLNSGSIVELNRTINDPVEIIVNNCVIARGEVVVVDGNYGVRIHQVVSREERLRTLK